LPIVVMKKQRLSSASKPIDETPPCNAVVMQRRWRR
jgi:hypothetical protein